MANTSLDLIGIFNILYHHYGTQSWWPNDDSPFEICVGAILTQGTSWKNVQKALSELKSRTILSLKSIDDLSHFDLASMIRSSGYFNQKAKKLKAFVNHLVTKHSAKLESMFEQPTQQLRRELLSIYGIGEETADDIILFAAMQHTFVVDNYTRRILGRMGMLPNPETYENIRLMFLHTLPRRITVYQEFHALFVQLAQRVCLKRKPLCSECPLLRHCPTGSNKRKVTT